VAALSAEAHDDEGDDMDREEGGRRSSGPAFTEISKVRHAIAVAKLPAVIEYLQGMIDEGVGKIIVFAHHRDVIDGLRKAFPAHACITGSTPVANRQQEVDRFQRDPACQLFIGNIQAAGVGITLTAAADVVFAELSWVPAEITQAEDRAHRIGQRSHVHVRHLVLDGSMDARIAQVIVDKQEIADKALDNPAEKLTLAEPVRAPRAGASVAAEGGRPATYPPIDDEKRALAHRAVQAIAGMCDGARALDGSGFNAMDTHIGHRLAECDRLTDGQAWLAIKLARKYRRQLGDGLREALGLDAKAVA
jgi:hypothetical protein